ncbi:hypothetical protein [Falsiroseomonas sp.]|uniref:hypothetical protein n=1 Tax=Falsiroseomonas sp. TaxID=2870721 RepID=UPI003568816E
MLALECRQEITLIKAVARAFRWRRILESGRFSTINELAAAEKINSSDVSRVLRLTLLAPDIVEAILDGRQREGMTLPGLMEGADADGACQSSCHAHLVTSWLWRPGCRLRGEGGRGGHVDLGGRCHGARCGEGTVLAILAMLAALRMVRAAAVGLLCSPTPSPALRGVSQVGTGKQARRPNWKAACPAARPARRCRARGWPTAIRATNTRRHALQEIRRSCGGSL